jgi:hypothetical protein
MISIPDIAEEHRSSDSCPKDITPLPFFGLPIDLIVTETVKSGGADGKGRRFPTVRAALAVSVPGWIMESAKALEQGLLRRGVLLGPKPLSELPPPGATVEQIEDATHRALNPQEYRPANERV